MPILILILLACASFLGCNAQLIDPKLAENTQAPFSQTFRDFAYSADFDVAAVSVYSVSSAGKLTRIQSIASGSFPLNTVPDRERKYLYVTNQGGRISIYRITRSTGELTWLENAGTATAKGNLVFHPNGNFVYVTVYDSPGAVEFYVRDNQTGHLNYVQTLSLGTDYPFGISITADGRFLYTANGGDFTTPGTTSVISLDQTHGLMTLVENKTADVAANDVMVHPSGAFLYVLNSGDYVSAGTATWYSINQGTGRLTYLGAIATGVASWFMNITPNGEFLYSANYIGNTVTAYRINQTTGTPTLIQTKAGINGADDIAFSSDYTQIYFPNYLTPGTISRYSYNATTGLIGGLVDSTSCGNGPDNIELVTIPQQ